ncbi:TRAP transporter substrate-binding protein [Oceanithermus sp.]
MKRRDFMKKAAVGVAASSVFGPVFAQTRKKVRWRMATSWPKSLDTIYGGAQTIADRVRAMTDGDFDIRVYAAGEIVSGLKVVDAVQQGTVQAGHTAGYYYIGKNPAFAFATALPFGLNFRQQNAWLYDGNGNKLLNEMFADFNMIGFPAGNTGVQMGGWFRKEINSVADLKGLKMRIPGLGGKVMSRLGVTVQVLAGGDIFPALERGAIDATEWVGPYDDEKLGFYKVAKYYYYPGWWEPGPTLHTFVNLKAWEALPKEYQQIYKTAAAQANQQMMVDYDFKNPPAFKRLLSKGVKLRRFSNEIMDAALKESFALFEETAAKDAFYKKVYEDWKAFREEIYRWYGTAESAYLQYVASRS